MDFRNLPQDKIFFRSEWECYDLPYTRDYLRLLDGLGLGPPRVYVGKRVGYRGEDLKRWLQNRISRQQ